MHITLGSFISSRIAQSICFASSNLLSSLSFIDFSSVMFGLSDFMIFSALLISRAQWCSICASNLFFIRHDGILGSKDHVVNWIYEITQKDF